MPDLPTLTLSQQHYDRVVAAFPGTDLTKKAAAYNAWLINNLIAFVRETEAKKLTDQYSAARAADLAALMSSLPNPVPYPPPP